MLCNIQGVPSPEIGPTERRLFESPEGEAARLRDEITRLKGELATALVRVQYEGTINAGLRSQLEKAEKAAEEAKAEAKVANDKLMTLVLAKQGPPSKS
ncbi:hypothetical protein BDW22DRAFT_1362619, partial [Trametopsis cervina]